MEWRGRDERVIMGDGYIFFAARQRAIEQYEWSAKFGADLVKGNERDERRISGEQRADDVGDDRNLIRYRNFP